MEASNVVKLTGENWSSWIFQTVITLKAKGLYEVVLGSNKPKAEETDYAKLIAEYNLKDTKAQDIIVSRLSESAISHVLSCDSACEIWTKLLTVYERKSELSLHLLQQKFFSLKFNSSETVSIFLSKVDDMINQMKQLGENISENMII